MATSGGACYDPPPAEDPWCSGPTCQPVTLEIAGSNPVGSAISLRFLLRPVRPPGRGVLCPGDPIRARVRYAAARDRPRPRLRPPRPRPPRRRPSRAPDRPAWLPPSRSGSWPSPSAPRSASRSSAAFGGGPSAPPSGIAARPSSAAGSPSRRRRRRRPRPTARAGESPGAIATRPSAIAVAVPRRRRRRRRDRPGDQLPVAAQSRRSAPTCAAIAAGGDGRSTGARPRRGRRRRDPRGARAGPRRRSASSSSPSPRPPTLAARLAKHRTATRVPARGRRRPVGPRARLGQRARCSAWTGSRSLDDWPLQRHAARGRAARRRATTRPRAWTMVAGGDILLDRGVTLAIDGQRRRLPVRRRHRRDHRHLQGLLAARLGHCRTRSGPATPARCATSSRAPTSRSPTSRTRPPTTSRFHGRGHRASPPTPPTSRALADAGIDWVSLANNHIGDAGRRRDAPDDPEPRQARHRARRRWAGTTKAAHKAALLEVGDVTVGPARLRRDRAVVLRRRPTRPGSARITEGAQARHRGGARGRRGRRGRDAALGRRVPGRRRTAQQQKLGARRDRRRRGHGHRQPPALGGRDGGLQGQADLVRARQLRVRPDLVDPDDGGDHARADVRRHATSSRRGCGPT